MRLLPPAATLALVLSLAGSATDAQEVGDRIRVRLFEDEPWTTGRLIDFADTTLTLRGPVADRPESVFTVREIERAEWHDPPNLAANMLIGAGASAAFQVISPCDPDPRSGPGCITGSRGSEVALYAGIGLVAGLVVYLVSPASWKTWIEDGRLRG